MDKGYMSHIFKLVRATGHRVKKMVIFPSYKVKGAPPRAPLATQLKIAAETMGIRDFVLCD